MSDKVKILGIALLLLALNSNALTLGRLRGVALVGQPLDVLVQVPLAAEEDASGVCFSADVFYADVLQDASSVRVNVEPAGQDMGLKARISSSALVNDPVVRVVLHAGCAQKISRRYVLLSDIPSETMAPPAPQVRTASVMAPVSVTPLPPVSSPVAKVKAEVKVVPVAAPKPAVKPPVAVIAKPKPVKLVEPVKPAPQALVPDKPKEQALEAAMALALAEDAALKAQQLQALQSSVKAALDLTAKHDASVLELKNKLQTAQAQHIPGAWLYGLIALALAGLAGVAFLLYRPKAANADSGDWLSGSVLGPDAAAPEIVPFTSSRLLDENVELDFTLPPEEEPVIADPKFSLNASAMDEVDVDHIEMSDSKFGAFMPNGLTLAQSQSPTPAVAAVQPKVHKLNLTEESSQDIRQQAEFFVSLGQTARAVAVLKKKIEAGGDLNPHLYLDLLSIYQSQGLKDDFETLRESFNTLFNCKTAEYALFKSEGQSLDFYPDVVKQISAAWPSPEALTVLESYILRDAQATPHRPLDLAAFRDLMMLHAVGQSLAFPQQSPDEHPVLETFSPVAQGDDMGELDLNLDFELPDSIMDGAAPSPVAVMDLDLELPLLFPSAQAELHTGNLIEFDPPPLTRKA